MRNSCLLVLPNSAGFLKRRPRVCRLSHVNGITADAQSSIRFRSSVPLPEVPANDPSPDHGQVYSLNLTRTRTRDYRERPARYSFKYRPVQYNVARIMKFQAARFRERCQDQGNQLADYRIAPHLADRSAAEEGRGGTRLIARCAFHAGPPMGNRFPRSPYLGPGISSTYVRAGCAGCHAARYRVGPARPSRVDPTPRLPFVPAFVPIH